MEAARAWRVAKSYLTAQHVRDKVKAERHEQLARVTEQIRQVRLGLVKPAADNSPLRSMNDEDPDALNSRVKDPIPTQKQEGGEEKPIAMPHEDKTEWQYQQASENAQQQSSRTDDAATASPEGGV